MGLIFKFFFGVIVKNSELLVRFILIFFSFIIVGNYVLGI